MRVFWKTDTSLHGGRRGGVRENSRLASMERASPEAFLVPACGPCSEDLLDNPDLGSSLFQVLGVTGLQRLSSCAMALHQKMDTLLIRCTMTPLKDPPESGTGPPRSSSHSKIVPEDNLRVGPEQVAPTNDSANGLPSLLSCILLHEYLGPRYVV